MMSLYKNRDMTIESAYVITIKGNETSENLAKRCIESCEEVGQPVKNWYAYDGITSGIITPPEHLMNDPFMKMLKLSQHYSTRTEIAATLSHISLWKHCAEIDKPIIILEHDAIMVKRLHDHPSYNGIIWLGGREWAKMGWDMNLHIPPLATDGPNKLFLCRAHSYSIDPAVARNMLSYVLKYGVHEAPDLTVRADLFNISHRGMYAYEEDDSLTTILNRPKDGHYHKRNDKLEW